MIDGDPSAQSGRTTSDERFGRPPRRSPAHPPLARRSSELVRLLKDLGAEPKPRTVHQLRTTIRRVETLLPDDRHGADAEHKVRKQLDRVRRRAGKVRDVDVQVKALRSLPPALDGNGRTELCEALEKARDKRLKRLRRAIADERDRGLVRRLRQVVADPHAVLEDQDAALADVLDAFMRARAAAEPLGAETLHAFRIAMKRLRYRAETLTTSRAAATAVVELKRLQDAIGEWHDWLTLGVRAEDELGARGAALVAAVRSRIATELANAVRVTERVSRRLAKLRPSAARKGIRRMTAADLDGPRQSAAALP